MDQELSRDSYGRSSS